GRASCSARAPACPGRRRPGAASRPPPSGSARTARCSRTRDVVSPSQISRYQKDIRERKSLLEHLPSLLVREHLALHALERVVDRLRVAAEFVGHRLVRLALAVELERVGLELGEAGAEREDEALKLFGRDHADGGVVDGGAGERV